MYDSLYERGIAVGSADIRNDTVLFRYRDETFEFPTSKVYHMKFGPDYGWNGYFYTAPVEQASRAQAGARKDPLRWPTQKKKTLKRARQQKTIRKTSSTTPVAS
jgi:hypothetical protein